MLFASLCVAVKGLDGRKNGSDKADSAYGHPYPGITHFCKQSGARNRGAYYGWKPYGVMILTEFLGNMEMGSLTSVDALLPIGYRALQVVGHLTTPHTLRWALAQLWLRHSGLEARVLAGTA
jgi:hypothetical protein